jgi:NAD(P)H-hydrate epimerase
MAKGGSGDVLTGILTALLAQKFTAEKAAIIGVYVHGLAGDLAAAKIGQNAIIASDIVEFLGQSFGR